MRREEGKRHDGARELHPVRGVLGSATSSGDVSFLKDSREEQKLTRPILERRPADWQH